MLNSKISNYNYPIEFERIRSTGIQNLEPWQFITNENFDNYCSLLNSAGDSEWIPFAFRKDYFCCVCWQKSGDKKVYYVDDHGRYIHESYDNIYEWLKVAVNDFIEWE